MSTQLDLTKRALAEIGTRTSITALDDGTAEATYANLLYAPLRDFLLREGDYDWAMARALSAQTSNQVDPWNYSYTYPANAIRIRSAIPYSYDPLDPVPVEWNLWTSSSGREIATKVRVSSFLYTLAPSEAVWDAIFQESFVRLLGSALTFALQNRIEASKKALEESLSFARIADMRQTT